MVPLRLKLIYICSCLKCLEGNFLNCSIKKNNAVRGGEDDEIDTDSELEYDNEDIFGDEIYDDLCERYEMQSESVLEVVAKRCDCFVLSV